MCELIYVRIPPCLTLVEIFGLVENPIFLYRLRFICKDFRTIIDNINNNYEYHNLIQNDINFLCCKGHINNFKW